MELFLAYAFFGCKLTKRVKDSNCWVMRITRWQNYMSAYSSLLCKKMNLSAYPTLTDDYQ